MDNDVEQIMSAALFQICATTVHHGYQAFTTDNIEMKVCKPYTDGLTLIEIVEVKKTKILCGQLGDQCTICRHFD